jgi:hypothetical protein
VRPIYDGMTAAQEQKVLEKWVDACDPMEGLITVQ